VVTLLVEGGAKIDHWEGIQVRTPLHLASMAGHAAVVTLLAEGGADITALDAKRMTPLHLACQEGHVDVASVLLDRQADMEAKDDSNCTPLELPDKQGTRRWSLCCGERQVRGLSVGNYVFWCNLVRALLYKQATKQSRPPLHRAVQRPSSLRRPLHASRRTAALTSLGVPRRSASDPLGARRAGACAIAPHDEQHVAWPGAASSALAH
jgi:hypothetical protein